LANRSGIEFIKGTEKSLARDPVDIDALLVVIPVFVLKWRFGAVLAHDRVLFGGEEFLELSSFWEDRTAGPVFGRISFFVFQPSKNPSVAA